VAQSPNDIYGTIENGRYVNNHLKFQLTIPDGWLVVESEEQKAAKQIGLNAVKTGDPKADTLIEKSAKADTLILFVSEKPLGSIENAAFGMSVTNLPSKGYTPKMLAESFKSVFLKNPKNKLVKDISIEKIGDWLWANVQMDLDLFGNLVHTNYFVTVIGDQALVANMSYQNSLQLQKMRTSLDGIRLASK
jgi:hypothetical protein